METGGDKTRLDTVRTAHDRAVASMLEFPVALSPNGQRINAVQALCFLGMEYPRALQMLRNIAGVYHNEMYASWGALFSPVEIVKPKPKPRWKDSVTVLARGVVEGLAMIGAVTILNAIARNFS